MNPPEDPPLTILRGAAAAWVVLAAVAVTLAASSPADARPRVVGDAVVGSLATFAPGPRPARAAGARRVRWQTMSAASGGWTTVAGATGLRWAVPSVAGSTRLRACVRWTASRAWRCSAPVEIRLGLATTPVSFAGPATPAPPFSSSPGGGNGGGQTGDAPGGGDPPPQGDPPSVAYGTTRIATPGESFSPQVAGGTGSLSFSYTGTLPPGVIFDGATGTLTAPSASDWTVEVASLAAGDGHSCARATNGMVWCWGDGSRGQLGSGSTNSSQVPVPVMAPSGSGYLTGVTAVTAGGNFSCALLEGGTAVCWGAGTEGQLGVGGSTDSLRPVRVTSAGDGSAPLADVVSIDAGDSHACAAVGTAGSAQAVCWGLGTSGQLGTGDANSASAPRGVVGVGGTGRLETVSSVTAGDAHSCALLAAGTVRCWGEQQWGRLGNGTGLAGTMAAPVAVNVFGSGSPPVLATGVSAGGANTCASVGGAAGRCWGDNRTAQTWDRISAGGVGSPVNLAGASGGPMSAGGTFSCTALTVTGQGRCWGANTVGQAGQGTTTASAVGQGTAVKDPLGSAALTGISTISTGEAHACALLADASAMCWGRGTSGQLGDAGSVSSSLPRPVARSGPRTGYPAVITVTVTDGAGRSGSTQVTLTAG